MRRVDTYGKRLAHAIELAGGMKQTELADAIGVKKATVNQVLSGKTNCLNAPNSALAARLLKVDHDWLATGEGEPRPLLMHERMSLSAKAVYIGQLLDDISDPEKREKAYALIVQVLAFGAGLN